MPKKMPKIPLFHIEICRKPLVFSGKFCGSPPTEMSEICALTVEERSDRTLYGLWMVTPWGAEVASYRPVYLSKWACALLYVQKSVSSN